MKRFRHGSCRDTEQWLTEADDQLHEAGCERPTHVFIQAGVGSLAGAVQGYLR